jgi:RNA polymerase sigma factor (sigma-70 family)
MADDEFSVTALVAAAAQGDQSAWNDIVDRYSPLLVGVLRQCRLTAADTEDVAQTVWLRLVEHLDTLREAHALPLWIVTTGRHEAWRQAAIGRRIQLRDPESGEWTRRAADVDTPEDTLLRVERQHALLAGLAELGGRDRQLLLLLMEDPPPSYAEISRSTGIPVGGIGPTRARALAKLRRTQAIQAIQAFAADRPESTTRAMG